MKFTVDEFYAQKKCITNVVIDNGLYETRWVFGKWWYRNSPLEKFRPLKNK